MAKPSKTSTNPPGKSDKHENGLLDWDLSILPEMGIETGGPPQPYIYSTDGEDIEEIAQGINIPEFPADHPLAEEVADRLEEGDFDYVFVATNGKDDLVDASNIDEEEPSGGLIITGNGKDNILAGAGNDVILAGNAKDVIDGGDGDDAMFGENGDDTFLPGSGSDLFHGGDGIDTIDASGILEPRDPPLTLEEVFSTFGIIEAQEISDAEMDKGDVNGVVVDLAQGLLSTGDEEGDDTLISIENITGSAFNDFMAGDENANHFSGIGGSDYLLGRAGDDTLHGGGDADLIIGGAGGDTLDGGEGDDMIFGDDDGLTPSGDAGGDTIFGGAGADMIWGEAGGDTIDGGTGDDLIEGGEDADMIDGGDDNDTASYVSSGAGVMVDLGADTASGGHADGDNLDNIENLIGSAHEDMLTGDAGANVIEGGDSADMIDGGDGVDELHAGQGEDVLFGGNGGDNDTIFLDGGNLLSVDDRDNSVDIVEAAATFAENGTDTVLFYGDGVLNTLAIDVIDFSDALDFTGGLTAEQQAVELLDLLYFDEVSSEIRDTGGDGVIGGGDDNAWFIIDELDTGNEPETVFVEVDGQTFEWSNDGITMEWLVV